MTKTKKQDWNFLTIVGILLIMLGGTLMIIEIVVLKTTDFFDAFYGYFIMVIGTILAFIGAFQPDPKK
jgi:uncharacterized membrane protein HdeD (DUF308 family)